MSEQIIPWICNICGYTSDKIESHACDMCYKISCQTHLQRVMRKNHDNGLYELAMICPECALEGVL